jgi:hypothetical protein
MNEKILNKKIQQLELFSPIKELIVFAGKVPEDTKRKLENVLVEMEKVASHHTEWEVEHTLNSLINQTIRRLADVVSECDQAKAIWKADNELKAGVENGEAVSNLSDPEKELLYLYREIREELSKNYK